MKKTKFSIIGSGYFVKVFDTDHPLYKTLSEVNKDDFYKYILDYKNFETLGLRDEKGRPYSTYYEILPSQSFPVYCPDPFTRLEIRQENLKTMKLFLKNVIRTDYLFPPNYSFKETILKNDGLLILEYDKGHWGSNTHLNEFNPNDNISFETIYVPEIGQKLIKKISINSNEIILKNPETLSCRTQYFMA